MRIKTRDMVLIALFAALTAVGAFIKIPTPLVPFTFQFLFVAYSGALLGARYGLYSQLLYIMIGLIGLPIFSYGGGPGYVFHPTFGYLLGFALCAYVVGKIVERLEKISFVKILGAILFGLFLVYLIGAGYLYTIKNLYNGEAMSLKAVIMGGVALFVPLDVIKSIIVAATSVYVIPILRRAGYIN